MCNRKSQRFEMRAGPDDIEKIQALAGRLGCTQSQAVRRAVTAALTQGISPALLVLEQELPDFEFDLSCPPHPDEVAAALAAAGPDDIVS